MHPFLGSPTQATHRAAATGDPHESVGGARRVLRKRSSASLRAMLPEDVTSPRQRPTPERVRFQGMSLSKPSRTIVVEPVQATPVPVEPPREPAAPVKAPTPAAAPK